MERLEYKRRDLHESLPLEIQIIKKDEIFYSSNIRDGNWYENNFVDFITLNVNNGCVVNLI